MNPFGGWYQEVPLHVALITDTYPPDHGGTPKVLERFVSMLRQRDHAVSVVRPRRPGEAHSGDPETLLVGSWRLPLDASLRLGKPAWSRLRGFLLERRPDLVHVATQGPLGVAALLLARREGLPATAGFHTNFHVFARYYGWGWLKPAIVAYLRAVHRLPAANFVPSTETLAELSALGFRRLRVVGRGVDAERFSPAWRSRGLRERWGAAGDEVVVAYVGRLAPEKNLGLFVEAVREIRARWPSVRGVIAGAGPLAPELSRVPGVACVGRLEGAELAALYASADLFLFPSRSETFGNVILEAMASGLPIVALPGGAASACLRDAGLVVSDDVEFVRAACGLAGDVALRERLGAAARERARSFGWAAAGDALEREMIDAIGRSRDRASRRR